MNAQKRARRRIRLLRGLGIALIVLGVATIAFVAQQLWVNQISPALAQDRLDEQLAERLAEPTATTIPETFFGDDPTMAMPIGIGVPETEELVTAPAVTLPEPEDPSSLDASRPDPILIPEAPPPQGTALGRIVINDAGVDWVVVEGVTPNDLALGPGHMPGTAMPGQPGNAVISGHRTTNGAPFFHLDGLEPGDTISVETLVGTHIYEVVEIHIVDPYAAWVIQQVDGAWLTLTTCNPLYRSIERLIVFAQLVEGPNADTISALTTGDEEPPRPPEGLGTTDVPNVSRFPRS